MSAIFCCSSLNPYRPRQLDHEAKFTAFTRWAHLHKSSLASVDGSDSIAKGAPYAVQLVKQINYGPQESIRYFVPGRDGLGLTETTEDDLTKSNFEKLNSCATHNKFFEVNLYQENATNSRHWRSTLARPSRDIDLVFRRQEAEPGPSKKTGELGGQEIQHESASSSVARFLGQSPTLPAFKEVDGKAFNELEPTNCPDIETLKRMLRFLLPTVGHSLGSSPLLTLLCLDRANAELDLGLDFESLWEAQLTSSNILLLIADSLVMDGGLEGTVLLAEVEALVVPAVLYVNSHQGQQLAGRVRLYEIVKSALESGRALEWVSAYGEAILRTLKSGPSDELLGHCGQRNQKLRNDRNAEEIHERKDEKDVEESTPWCEGDFYDGRYEDYGYDYDSGPEKDYTACDKECGYCGNCDY